MRHSPWIHFLVLALVALGSSGTSIAQTRSPDTRQSVGYEISQLRYVNADGKAVERRLLLWYPSADPEARYDYRGQIGRAVQNGRVRSGKHPIVLFSHGYLGGADQSIFITENLARMGYVVVAPEHADAGKNAAKGGVASLDFGVPGPWPERKFFDRKEDLSAALDELQARNADPKSPFYGSLDFDRVGALGHSLGGYTVLGLAGARESWRDTRIRAVVGLSPYVAPLGRPTSKLSIAVPVALQGGGLDIGVTPTLPAFYEALPAPKLYLVLRAENHLGWTNLASAGTDTVTAVRRGNPRWIVGYTVAFFDQYLKGEDRSAVLTRRNRALQSIQYSAASKPM